MNKLTHEQFDKMWEDSTKEEVLFQFYYDYYKKVEALDRIDKAIEILSEDFRNCPMSLTVEKSYIIEVEKIKKVLNILKGSEE